jgi:hypothetical protein
MKNSKLLLEEALFNSHLNTLLVLTESDVKELDPKLTPEELSALTESFKEDPELLVEFLGTIAGLGGKAAKYLGNKAAGFAGSMLQKGQKMSDYSDAKKADKFKRSSRLAHRKAVVNYGKSLKSKDPGARLASYEAMVNARKQSQGARGRTPGNAGVGPFGGEVDYKAQSMPQSKKNYYHKKKMYSRLGEALINATLEALNEKREGDDKIAHDKAKAALNSADKEKRKSTAKAWNPKHRSQAAFEKGMKTNQMKRISKKKAPSNKRSSSSYEERIEKKVEAGFDRDEAESYAHVTRENARHKEWAREHARKKK